MSCVIISPYGNRHFAQSGLYEHTTHRQGARLYSDNTLRAMAGGDRMTRLFCWLRGHDPLRLNGTFYVVCRRCNATINLRVSTWRSA